MATSATDPQNSAEKLIVWTIQGVWAFWALGALYIVGPALGWLLALMAATRLYLAPGLPVAKRPPPLSLAIWAWLAGMGAMEIILLIGHFGHDLGAGQTIKSTIGWAKGWALIALFPLSAAVLEIRAEPIYRAVCKLGLQSLILLPLFIAAPYVGLPGLAYVSPLSVVGGSGPEYFAVILYTIEPGLGTPRWQFFAPWSPAAGLIAVVHVLCAIEERDLKWKATGLVSSVMIALLSQSRLALVAVAIIWPMAFAVSRLRRAWMWFAAAPVILVAGLFAPQLLSLADRAASGFAGARADSSRVRAALGRIAVERWEKEAYWFGHGIVENGPHLVEYMPIGSHHSWFGLLFVKGLSGVFALAIPFAVSLWMAAKLSMSEPIGRVALAMILVLLLYSFGENLEILSYLYWPALVIIGIAARHATLAGTSSPSTVPVRDRDDPAGA